jgi:hypothetical protein
MTAAGSSLNTHTPNRPNRHALHAQQANVLDKPSSCGCVRPSNLQIRDSGCMFPLCELELKPIVALGRVAIPRQ